jgi:preprotein translocase subunit YajC
MWFITEAYAQSTTPGGGGMDEIIKLIAPILMVLPIFYFFLIRPQQQRAKQHQATVNAIRRGDTVILSSGIIGKVTKVVDGNPEIEVEIADNTRVRVIKHTVAEVRAKGEPVKETT